MIMISKKILTNTIITHTPTPWTHSTQHAQHKIKREKRRKKEFGREREENRGGEGILGHHSCMYKDFTL